MENDITPEKLSLMGEEDSNYLLSLFRSIPGFPKEGINFRDYMPLLADARGLSILMDALVRALPVPADSIDEVAGLEARGFLIGVPLAAALHKGFVAVRKAGKLPPPIEHADYSLEYGTASLEIEQGIIKPGTRVLVVDDLIATGGTAHAAKTLIESVGGTVCGFSFIMKLDGLDGCDKLGDVPISTLVSMPA